MSVDDDSDSYEDQESTDESREIGSGMEEEDTEYDDKNRIGNLDQSGSSGMNISYRKNDQYSTDDPEHTSNTESPPGFRWYLDPLDSLCED